MPGELVVIERQLEAIRPRLDMALGGIMPATRLEQTILVSCERVPELLRCTPQSVLNAAMTFAVLGLPVDGATGQGFMLPFKGQAQAVIGYKGYNTLGARAGLTITAGTVREGDVFEYELGSHGFVRHRPLLDNNSRIVAFWSCAAALQRPPIIAVLSLGDVLAVKEKSPGAKRSASPWNDPHIGFAAMGEKTARRRLARSTPLRIDAPQFQQAARVEEAFDEQGRLAWITPEKGVVVEGDPASHVLPDRHTETPTLERLTNQNSVSQSDVEGHANIEAALKKAASEGGTPALLVAWRNLTPKEQHLWARMKDLHFKPMAERRDKELQEEALRDSERAT